MKQRKTLFGLLGSLLFAFVGLIFSFWWLFSYLYSRASEVDFLSGRLGDMTREYLAYLVTIIGLTLINSRLTVGDIMYIMVAMTLIVVAFAIAGFILGRVVEWFFSKL